MIRLQTNLPDNGSYVCVSDIHLGDGTKYEGFRRKDKEFSQLIEYCNDNKFKLIIAGDCIDLLQAGNMRRIYSAHKKLITRLQKMNGNLVYLPGNHEAEIDISSMFPKAQISPIAYIGKKVRIEHGNMYDPFGNTFTLVRILSHLEKMTGALIREPLNEYNHELNRLLHFTLDKIANVMDVTSRYLRGMGFRKLAHKMKNNVKYWKLMRGGDYNSLFYTIRRKLLSSTRLNRLIVGHSHLPGIVRLSNGKYYINLGSWTGDNSQYLLIKGRKYIQRDWRTGKTYSDENYVKLRELHRATDPANTHFKYKTAPAVMSLTTGNNS